MLGQMVCFIGVVLSIAGLKVTRRKVAEAKLFQAGIRQDWYDAEKVFRTAPSYLADVEAKYLMQQYVYGHGEIEFWQTMFASCLVGGVVCTLILLGPFML